MITIAGLWKQLGGEWVLRGIDLRVGEGEIVAIVGPSGTGKSVLLRHAAGLIWPDSGVVEVNGVALPCRTARQRRRLRSRLGFVFQDGALLDSLTVRQNLQLAATDGPIDARSSDAPIRAALARVHLDPAQLLGRYPGELSGGMRKRVAVARALVRRPALLLCDEPTTGLDPRNSDAVHACIRTARDEDGATALVVTHEIAALPGFADRVVLLEHGRVRFDGTPAAFLDGNDPGLADFIGRSHPSHRRIRW